MNLKTLTVALRFDFDSCSKSDKFVRNAHLGRKHFVPGLFWRLCLCRLFFLSFFYPVFSFVPIVRALEKKKRSGCRRRGPLNQSIIHGLLGFGVDV